MSKGLLKAQGERLATDWSKDGQTLTPAAGEVILEFLNGKTLVSHQYRARELHLSGPFSFQRPALVSQVS